MPCRHLPVDDPLFLRPEGASYRHMLDRIAETMEARLATWAWDSAERFFARQAMVSRDLSLDVRDESMILADGDELIVLPPLAGG